MIQSIFINELLKLSFSKSVDSHVSERAFGAVRRISDKFLKDNDDHGHMLKIRIAQAQNNPSEWQSLEFNDLPPGSPIGCNQ
jgi:hypothetical protein